MGIPVGGAFAGASEGRWVPSLQVKPQGRVQLALFEDGTAFAYNTNDTPLWYSPNSGASWVPLPPPPSAGGTPSIDFASPDLGYTESGGSLFVTEDKALTWDLVGKVPLPQRHDSEWRFPTTDIFEAVRGTDSVVVVGDGFYVKDGCPVIKDEGLIWTSRDRGESWRFTEVPFPALGSEVEFFNARYGVVLLYELELIEKRACGHTYQGARSSVLLTDDAGRSFREIHSAYYDDEDPVTAVAMPSPRRIVLGTGSGKILLSTNAGRSYKEVALLENEVESQTGLGASFQIDALTFGTRKVGYAGTNGKGTWRTEDGGATWRSEPSHQSLAGLNIGDIAAVGPENALAGGAWAVARRVVGP